MVAELLFTTASFRPFSVAAAGVPILLDARMRLIEPACEWFLHLALVTRPHAQSGGLADLGRSALRLVAKHARRTAGRGIASATDYAPSTH